MECKECGKEMKQYVAQMIEDNITDYVCLSCGCACREGFVSEDTLERLREEELEQAQDEEREPLVWEEQK